MPIITKHGKKRLKGRLGLAKRSHLRHLSSVLKKGKLLSREGLRQFKVLYHNFIYIFALTDRLSPILVTTYIQPKKRFKRSMNIVR